MAASKIGPGPWGEAIRYWLPRKNMCQADLARASGIEPKTISTMTRGFHTTTRMLLKVSVALGVPLADVLVSPARQRLNDEAIREDMLKVLRTAVEQQRRKRSEQAYE
jgi:transcriptional regulator with XRE-family HTH domain